MIRLRDLMILGAAFALGVCCSLTVHAQAPATGAVTPASALAQLPQADPTAQSEPEGEPKRWLMQTPLVDIPWPQLKMPGLRWKSAEDDSPGPIDRFAQATRKAADNTRTAWNKGIDRLKVGPFASKPEGQPGMFAKFFGGGDSEPQQVETVADAIGQDRPSFR